MFRLEFSFQNPLIAPVVLALTLSLLACGDGGGGSSDPDPEPSDAVFPVGISSDRRVLEDATGAPFPILGRTAWFITSLPEADYKLFIDDTVAKGFNSIEFHVINHWPRGENPPFNGRGDLPFLNQLDGNAWDGRLWPHYDFGIEIEGADLTTPNEAYWVFVDELLAYAESKGVLCFMFPAYVGFPDSDQGWMYEMVANGAAKNHEYGVWVATRYQNQKNLVWMVGGDKQIYDAEQRVVEQALIDGLKSVPNQESKYYTAEWSRGSIATDQPDFGSEMTLNGTYANSRGITFQGRRAYARSPILPAFLLEEPFDEEGADGNSYNEDATQPVRRFQWWGMLSNIGGYIAGNGYIWPFTAGWQAHLDVQGARDMEKLNSFVRSIAWYRLVPSGLAGMQELVTDGASFTSEEDYVEAAATPDGTLLVAYIPPAHSGTITIDMTAMSGPARARWLNPATGNSNDLGVFPNVGSAVFDPPGDNGTGFDDWVLVLEKQ